MNGIYLHGRSGLLPVLVMITCTMLFSLRANAIKQGDLTVTLSAENITLAAVFKAIYQQTKMPVMYNNDQINDKEKVNVSFRQTKLDEVLRFLLEKKGYTWLYNAGYIVIRPQAKQEAAAQAKHTSLRSDTSVASQAVSGKVTDAAGMPLIGATVQVKGTGIGATTDADGNFTLPKATANNLLVISSMGYETRELPVKGRTIMARLNMAVNSLDETVIVAYGNTTQRYNAGNITTVKADEIAKQPVNNPLLALQGRVPGLFITQATGFSGSGVRIQIQGQNSIRQGNDPFYVIDGVPYTSQLLANFGNMLGSTGQNGNPLSFINPSDIESITVLKDADATAIYGSRAANGAVLITTKKAGIGQTRVNVNLQQGWGEVASKIDLLNTQQYVRMRKEAIDNDGLSIQPTDYDINGLWDTTRYTDWQKELLGGTAQYTNLYASVSGGTSNMQYLVGATYHRETTVFPGNFDDQKGAVHINLNSTSANNKFKIQFSGNYMLDNNRLPNDDITSRAIDLPPNAPAVYNADGSLNWMPDAAGTSTFSNPLAPLQRKYTAKTSNLVANTLLSYRFLPGLELLSSFGYTNMHTDETVIMPLSSESPELRPILPRVGKFGNNGINSWVIEPQINFTQSIGKGKLEALIGTSIQQKNSKGYQVNGIGFISDLVIGDIRSASTVSILSSTEAVYKYNAVFGRLNYNLDGKYIVNLTARRDGTSRFGSANRFHNFGAIGGAWIFSEEKFLKENLSLLSFGKLRASYGTTGNDQIGDYAYLNLYTRVTTGGVPYQGVVGLEPTGIPNPYLQWEETKKINIGVDLGFFKERILLNINYFHNRSSNQLINLALPSTAGFPSMTQNFAATVQNSGWEFALNTENIKTSDFSWSTRVNVTIPKNKLVKYDNLANSSDANFYVIGKPITIMKLFQYRGVDPDLGIFQFADASGKITTTPDYFKDATVIQNTAPTLYGGIENSFTYKGFQLDFLFQFVKRNGFNYSLGNLPGTPRNQPTTVLDRWQKPGDQASIQSYNSDYSRVGPYFNALGSDFAIRDASFIRLKNASLSWRLPAKFQEVLNLKNARLYMQGQNLLTITDYVGLDPETLNSTFLPPLRVWTFGVQIGL